MSHLLHSEEQAELLRRGFTRRAFGRITTMVTAGSALPFFNEGALAQRAAMASRLELPPDGVRISGNENPMGPCAEAVEAMRNVIPKGGYYGRREPMELMEAVGDIEGVKPNYVAPFAGSGDPLFRSVLAFCSPKKSFVTADPGYESGERAAEFIGAKVIRVPLTKEYAHDVKAMVKADPNAGIIYICNPNNPSGTITSKSDIEWAVANKPAGSLLLLDEAYVHISKEWENRGAPLVAADKDVMILRTFSKLYGMAGLRAGFAMSRPDLLAKLRPWGSGSMPVTGAVGATASVRAKTLVPERRKTIREIREDVFGLLDKHKITYIASDANFFMMDTKRPAEEFMKAMMQHKVMVGRSWSIWPTYSRVTVGSRSDMEQFKAAVVKVMA
jgi:histidinol-phosphate aminotransferase